MQQNQSKPETRLVSHPVNLEKRAEGEGEIIVGYAAVFEQLSENLGGFREKIQAGAFDEVLNDDVRALINHDPNLILGRNGKTLRLSIDATGLRYEVDAPETSYAKDLMVSMQRGDITQSSFAFYVDEDRWDEDEDGRVIRTILKIRELVDVSPVTYPAYPDTTAAQRSLDNFKKHNQAKDSIKANARTRAIQLLNLK